MGKNRALHGNFKLVEGFFAGFEKNKGEYEILELSLQLVIFHDVFHNHVMIHQVCFCPSDEHIYTMLFLGEMLERSATEHSFHHHTIHTKALRVTLCLAL